MYIFARRSYFSLAVESLKPQLAMSIASESAAKTSDYAELALRPLDPEQCALIVIDVQQKLLPPIVLGTGAILLNFSRPATHSQYSTADPRRRHSENSCVGEHPIRKRTRRYRA